MDHVLAYVQPSQNLAPPCSRTKSVLSELSDFFPASGVVAKF